MDSTRKEITSKLDSELVPKLISEVSSKLVSKLLSELSSELGLIQSLELWPELKSEINQMITHG
jgi:hypothetical protein